MNNINKIGIGVSLLSLTIIAGSLYYHNDKLSKASDNIVKNNYSTKEVVVENKKNIEISTEVNNNTLILKLKNISSRELADVVLEVGVKDSKVSEVYIEKFAANTEKTIEISLNKKTTSQSIRNNDTIVNDYRLMEEKEFTYNNEKGYVLVTSIKEQKVDYYKDKINSSSLSQEEKDQLLSSIDKENNIYNIEKLIEGKLIPLLRLSLDAITFPANEEKLVISDKVADNLQNSQDSSNNVQEIPNNSVPQDQQASSQQYVAPNSSNINNGTNQVSPRRNQSSIGTNSNNRA
ncbi:hypothetical protein HZY83_04180 [Gemella sp. GH3]|uniref:hypothetical protein n=1 Tax=unclassified Gemella TaxID=2624949 RepID=UPI0015D07DC2|nr:MULTISPECIES: hypothetical protein [unclassified Gemella]MBF0713878.1 hypothetical protein [Gemella sp. GH3.1]NYS50830.1 hypothetical protein [Gemella sp. GH3]